MHPQEFQKAWSMVVARAWSDAAFKERLFKDPKTVLTELGIDVPENIKKVENSDALWGATILGMNSPLKRWTQWRKSVLNAKTLR
jgi:hypothetical protein